MSDPFRICAPLNHSATPALQTIETASSLQIPAFHVVGLPSQEIFEARERVRAAIEAAGFEFPRRRVVLNLSPASIRKQGTGLELAMALAVLASDAAAPLPGGTTVASGELSLDGRIRGTGQTLRALHAAWASGARRILLPRDSAGQARAALALLHETREFEREAPEILLVDDLPGAWAALRDPGSGDCLELDPAPAPAIVTGTLPGFRGATARDEFAALPLAAGLARALGVAATGRHHLLLVGPRGTGKSHAAECFARLQPPAPPGVRLRRALLTEMRGDRPLDDGDPSELRIVRRVGLQTRAPALTGSLGANQLRPGEFSLAHGGVLLADELPEWSRDAREALREPLERGWVTLSRANGNVELPARFTLAATANLCPCGGWPSETRRGGAPARDQPSCRCGARERELYRQRLSGPILDRIDLVLTVLQSPGSGRGAVRFEELRDRARVARERAIARFGRPTGDLDAAELEARLAGDLGYAALSERVPGLSLRGRHKVARLALSLACWDDRPVPEPGHWAEAASYRPEAAGMT